jgi:hypothetical protein
VDAIFRTSTLAALATSKKYHSLKWPPRSLCQFWAKSALGQKRTFFTASFYDCFAPESGHLGAGAAGII